MKIIRTAVKRPVTIAMFILIIIIMGVVSLTQIPIDLFPQIKYPIAVVITNYPGVGPQEVEELVTQPIEEVVATVNDIKKITSTSSEGSSLVIAEFNYGTDMDFAALDMREKIDMIQEYLPDDIKNPRVSKIDITAMPVVELSIEGDKSLNEVKRIAKNKIKSKLERISGVASVSVEGGYENQIEIVVDQKELNGYGLAINHIANLIGAENLNLPGGEINNGNKKLTIKTKGKFKSVEEIKNLPISLPNGGIIHLKDFATVALNYKDQDSIIKSDGKECIYLSVKKESGSNTVKVAEKVINTVSHLNDELEGLEIKILMDTSKYIKDSISSVNKNIAIGGILAVLVLMVFLRNIRTTVIIGIAIPISVIATFILIYFNHMTLNMMSLGGLALGVGMLVDNSIVVLENIFRYRKEGHSKIDASINGAEEVGTAIMASTLTTIVVFLPMAFVKGIVGEIFKDFSLVVVMSLLASLVVSITLIPMLCSKYLKMDESKDVLHKFKLSRKVFNSFDTFFSKLENHYKRALNWALANRKKTIIIGITTFVVSITSIISVGMVFFPESDTGWISINISKPKGTEIEDTSKEAENVVSIIQDSDIKEIEQIFFVVGVSEFEGESAATDKALMYAKLFPKKERKRDSFEIADQIRTLTKDIAGAEIRVSTIESMEAGGQPIEIEIAGKDLNLLKEIGEDVKKIVRSVEGTREIKSSMEDGVPEVIVNLNRNKASQYGLTGNDVATTVSGMIKGAKATTYKYDGDDIDVIIKGDPMLKKSTSNLKQTLIEAPTGVNVPLYQIADVSIKEGPVAIERANQKRVIKITGKNFQRDIGSINKEIDNKLSNYPFPDDFSYKFGGQGEEMNKAFRNLLMALVLSIVFVYMVIASQFESLIHPFTIMLSVPLAVSGGLLGLFITRRPLCVPALIGIIMLSGIVVNNAIVLIDYINIRRNRGEDRKEAILNAGPIRLRPILMTTLTTALGLVPLSLGIGDGAETQAPMATVVIGGLLLSTLLTLVFIPVIYTILDDWIIRFKSRKLNKKNSDCMEC